MGGRELILFEPFCDPFDHFLLYLLHFKVVLFQIRIGKLLFIKIERLSLIIFLYL
jgi:hypothetical protein